LNDDQYQDSFSCSRIAKAEDIEGLRASASPYQPKVKSSKIVEDPASILVKALA